MRFYTSVTLVSLLTLSLAVNAHDSRDRSVSLFQSTPAHSLLSLVKTGDAGPQGPETNRGGQRRFFTSQDTLAPQICHRGSGRREFTWA
ncbi:heterocyst-inhibiting protein PatX [Coleofasciculus sp. E2-BRE-01]|jgi:hypothetical protein|uniref:heterocyst-inhibiting protein PatX n=1 Tax=unclassified Coleofasciculus TaxID=2692782 RepID=UPI004064C6EF